MLRDIKGNRNCQKSSW